MCKYLSTDVAQALTHQNRHLAVSTDSVWEVCVGVSQWNTTADTPWDHSSVLGSKVEDKENSKKQNIIFSLRYLLIGFGGVFLWIYFYLF